MPPADVERVVEPLVVVGADVEQDRQRRGRVDAAAGRVERELADRDAHAAGALVAQAEDALAVGDDDHLDLRRGGVLQDRVDVVALRIGDEQAARAAIDVAELLAGEADRRRVDDRHHLGQVVEQEPVEQRLVGVLELAQVDVPFEVGRLRAIGLVRPDTCSSSVSSIGGSRPSRPNVRRSSRVNAVPLFNRGRSSNRCPPKRYFEGIGTDGAR